MKRITILGICLAFVFGLAAGEASATLSYDLKYVLNGNTSIDPAGWLTVAFDTVTPGTVTLSITSNLPDPAYYFDAVAFNVDPTKLGSLSWGTPTMLGAKAPDITSGENTQTVPGSGSLGSGFDVLLSFTNKGGGNPTHRFDDSNTLTLTLTGTGINENSFYFFNSPPPGDIQSNVGAHVAGLPGSTSSFISNVPIPPAVWLLGSGLACLVVVRRQMKK